MHIFGKCRNIMEKRGNAMIFTDTAYSKKLKSYYQKEYGSGCGGRSWWHKCSCHKSHHSEKLGCHDFIFALRPNGCWVNIDQGRGAIAHCSCKGPYDDGNQHSEQGRRMKHKLLMTDEGHLIFIYELSGR